MRCCLLLVEHRVLCVIVGPRSSAFAFIATEVQETQHYCIVLSFDCLWLTWRQSAVYEYWVMRFQGRAETNFFGFREAQRDVSTPAYTLPHYAEIDGLMMQDSHDLQPQACCGAPQGMQGYENGDAVPQKGIET